MKGLELCENYYRSKVEPALLSACPEAMPHLAAGLAGEGSECLGFDDEISRDHDFGPRVCIWMTDEAAAQYGDKIQGILNALPAKMDGVSAGLKTQEAAGRSGVIRIRDFYRKYTALQEVPARWQDWIRIPEENLATCTNGKVFYDGEGIFSEIRNTYLNYYPEDIRIKKIAARMGVMAQSGQYNYSRCMKRGETVAAFMALYEFVKNGMSIVYLLNKNYMPYYKWAHRGLRELEILPELGDLFRQLVAEEKPEGAASQRFAGGLDFLKESPVCEDKSQLIEKICSCILEELVRQDLCRPGDNFLLAHANEITGKIEDPAIRALPLMFG